MHGPEVESRQAKKFVSSPKYFHRLWDTHSILFNDNREGFLPEVKHTRLEAEQSNPSTVKVTTLPHAFFSSKNTILQMTI